MSCSQHDQIFVLDVENKPSERYCISATVSHLTDGDKYDTTSEDVHVPLSFLYFEHSLESQRDTLQRLLFPN